MVLAFPVQAEEQISLPDWITVAAQKILTFSRDNHAMMRQDNRKYFTNYGFNEFYKAIEQAQYEKKMIEQDMALETTVLCTPVISDIAAPDWIEHEPEHIWEANFPIRSQWISEAGTLNQYMRIKAVISDNNKMAADDLGIEQWIASPISEQEATDCDSNS